MLFDGTHVFVVSLNVSQGKNIGRQGGLSRDYGRDADWLSGQLWNTIKITIFFYKIMISYETHPTLNLY